MTPRYPTTDLKLLAGLGVLVVLTAFFLPLIGLGYFLRETVRFQECAGRSGLDSGCEPGPLWKFLDRTVIEAGEGGASQPPVRETRGLGGEGSLCGGPERFPCMPGLGCQKEADEDYGICLTASVDTSIKTRNLGDACGEAIGPCVTGAVCKLSPGTAAGVCVKADDKAPQVMSLSLKGMALDQGWYLAEAGTEVELNVTAVNAVAATAYLTPKGTGMAEFRQKLTDLKRSEGGKFSGQFTVAAGLLADLEISVTSKDGQQASMSVNVAAR